MRTITLVLGLTVLSSISKINGQNSCPDPDTYGTICTIGDCGGVTGDCSYTTTFNTQFTGNKKYALITINANGTQVHTECIGPLANGTTSYSVSYVAPCGAVITGTYVAYTNSSVQNPCGGTVCESGTCAAGQCQETILPIELKSFTAAIEGKQIAIRWSTLSETNTAYFQVERSNDGRLWKILRTTPAANNSTEEQKYQIQDVNPLPGMNYYRLISADLDGQEDISGMVAVQHYSAQRDIYYSAQSNTIHINPNLSSPLSINLIDVQGHLIRKFRAETGSQISVSDLPAGIYLIQVVHANVIHQEKITIY